MRWWCPSFRPSTRLGSLARRPRPLAGARGLGRGAATSSTGSPERPWPGQCGAARPGGPRI
eukprot:2495932-Rhodomonas_salina.1